MRKEKTDLRCIQHEFKKLLIFEIILEDEEVTELWDVVLKVISEVDVWIESRVYSTIHQSCYDTHLFIEQVNKNLENLLIFIVYNFTLLCCLWRLQIPSHILILFHIHLISFSLFLLFWDTTAAFLLYLGLFIISCVPPSVNSLFSLLWDLDQGFL